MFYNIDITFYFSAIMDCLIVPLQEKLEDWKRTVLNLDKEHAKGLFLLLYLFVNLLK